METVKLRELKKVLLIVITFSIIGGMSSCRKKGCTDETATNYNEKAKKDDGTCEFDDSYEVPTTYTFNDVRYDGQTARLQMLDMLSDEVNSASTSNAVNYSDLEAIYKNISGSLFGSSKDLYGKTYSLDQQYFLDLLTTIDTTSINGSGVMEGDYYVTNQGVEIDQLIQKGLMGAVLYYQATSGYLEDISGDDNTGAGGTEATDMEHHFDEAFGYFGAPTDFSDQSTTGDADFVANANFWGKYTISRNGELNNVETIFTAFRTGRAAISNEDYVARDAAIETIITEWEKVAAASVVHYINSVKADLTSGDLGSKYHHWAEGKGFAMCLKYNISKVISTADQSTVEAAFGNNPGAITVGSDFDASLTIIKNTYGFSDTQMTNF
ncbi:MAG: DUF4856 domain-containing protein [Flavobacteriales bacterium]|nr:DUF4856 domain-containing protein [Flavobacteriales bacterium]